MANLLKAWEAAKGYKTYAVALAAFIYGIYTKDTQVILFGLGLAGVRNGVSSEVAKVLVSKNIVAAAKVEAPVIAAEVATEVVAQ